MEFTSKEYFLLLLLLIPYIVWYFFYRAKREPSMRMSDTYAFQYAPKSWRLCIIHLPMLLRCLTFFLIVVVMARPQTHNSWGEKQVEGINIIDKDGKVKVKLTQTNEGLKVSDGNDKETRITNVAEGKNGTDAVNVKQLNAAKTEVTPGDNIDVRSSTGANGQTIYKVSANDTSAAVKGGSNHVEVTKAANTHKDGSTTVTDYTVDLSKETKEDIKKGVDAHTEVTTKGLTFNADTGTTGVKKLGSKVAVKGDGKNITTTANENGVTVSMEDNIKVNSVTANKVKVGDVNINENGINAGGKRITNVAPGKDGTDAVNVNQLKYVAGNISNQINNVDKGLRAGIAGALASGGLYHVTTAGKSMVSVGAGTYRGQNALAVGYSRLSDNGKVGVKFTVNSNSQGHSGASASVGYQW